ncbi:MAG: hypothetical protein HYX96_03010 [Chloroflexi bacterium]|nr:hypothetical protein [Chloroflexota bacterium]
MELPRKNNPSPTDSAGENTNSARDMAELLRSLEAVCRISSKNAWVLEFFRELREVLQKYPEEDIVKLVERLKDRGTKSRASTRRLVRRTLDVQQVASISITELAAIISDPDIRKDELLSIGALRFGLPKGSYSKVKKEDLRSRIRAAMENAETMKIISDRAGR